VRPRHLRTGGSTDATTLAVAADLRRHAGLAPGARVVLVMGGAANDPTGATSLIKLLTL
jgi:hypothetical protein